MFFFGIVFRLALRFVGIIFWPVILSFRRKSYSEHDTEGVSQSNVVLMSQVNCLLFDCGQHIVVLDAQMTALKEKFRRLESS
ncbi:hypothetical protein Bca52824_023831 [Brassica carinata]|uniref:Uncharacterized protein n=1 Tax=Brassica carinata TaxID=52824 RepID=A0A8X7VJA3_BRACI|nr:hypothetical protein Bca52824_023831 [Brassica carinata]